MCGLAAAFASRIHNHGCCSHKQSMDVDELAEDTAQLKVRLDPKLTYTMYTGAV